MTIRDRLRSQFVSLSYFLYRNSPFGTISRRAGVHPYLLGAYHRVLKSLTDSTQRVAIGDLSAEFYVPDLRVSSELNHLVQRERPILVDLAERLKNDDVFYDAGAHVGLYTCLVADAVEPGSVVAFEPFPPNSDYLERNVRLNGDTVDVQRTALGDRIDTVALRYGDDAGGLQSASVASNRPGQQVDVQMTTIDSLVDDHFPSPTILKLDVEGAELDVLRGATQTLADTVRLLYCEVHEGDQERQIRDLLTSHGLANIVVLNDSRPRILRASTVGS